MICIQSRKIQRVSHTYLLQNKRKVDRHPEKQVQNQAEVTENIKKEEELRMTPSCPLSLLCLQVSSTPNLIALISQLNMGRQKKDNSHPFWGRIRGISTEAERKGPENYCPTLKVGWVHHWNVFVKENIGKNHLHSEGEKSFSCEINQFGLSNTGAEHPQTRRCVSCSASHTSEMTHSSELTRWSRWHG